MKTRILVLGASGFVGRHLVKQLAGTEWAEVIAASRRARTGMRCVDGEDPVSLGTALADVGGVINCMAGRPEAMVANARALRAALEARPSPIPVVHFSSMAVYGAAEGSIGEQSPLQGVTAYGMAKVESERLLAPLPMLTIIRPGCIYGRGSPQWSARIARLVQAGRLGDLGTGGEGRTNLVHIDDVARAVSAALLVPDNNAGRIYNLAMRDAPSWNEYFAEYARLFGATSARRIGARRLALETYVLAPALKLAEVAGRKLGGVTVPPSLPPSLARLFRQKIELDPSRAENELKLDWTPWRSALQHEVQTGSREM
jgi:2-alkyl-3-oxoalkanoate reductase